MTSALRVQLTREQALERLTRWQQEGTALACYLATPGAAAGLTMLAQVAEVSVRLVLTNESTVLRFSLDAARFEFGPLQTMSLPWTRGPAVAVSHLPAGLAGADGLHVRLETGLHLFLCESRELGERWLNAAVTSLGSSDLGGLLS